MHDTISLSAGSLLRDHRLIRSLLSNFERATDPDRRKRLMRLTLDFFDLHSETEDRLFELEEPRAEHDMLETLSELVEMTHPGSNLYYARGMELAKSLRGHMSSEEALLTRAAGISSATVHSHAPLLLRREQMATQIRLALQPGHA